MTDTNTSGISPRGNRVLVKPDELEEQTESGIVIPDSIRDQHQQGQATGVLVAKGGDSWVESTETVSRLIDGEWKEVERRVTGYTEPFAEVGDRVFFARYAGLIVKGLDGCEYRILNDLDITAPIDEGIEFGDIKPRKAISP